MDNTFTDFFSSNNEDIEVITDEEVSKEENAPINDIFNQVNQTSTVDTKNEEPIEILEEEIVVKKKDKILMIQIILLVTWAILTSVIYFFGYDLFEPLINVNR